MFSHGTLYALGPGIWLAGMILLITLPLILSERRRERREGDSNGR